MDGGREVGRSQRETEVEEEGRSFEEREGGRDGGGRIYLFIFSYLAQLQPEDGEPGSSPCH